MSDYATRYSGKCLVRHLLSGKFNLSVLLLGDPEVVPDR